MSYYFYCKWDLEMWKKIWILPFLYMFSMLLRSLISSLKMFKSTVCSVSLVSCLITSSLHVLTNPEFTIFFKKLYVSSFRGLQSVFFCHNKQLYRQCISIENFYLVEKQNKENFVKKFVGSGIVKTCYELDLGSDLDICEAESCSPAVKETYF